MCLCQFGLNLAIGSEDRVQTQLFRKVMGACDLDGQGHEKLIIPLTVPIKYLCKFG